MCDYLFHECVYRLIGSVTATSSQTALTLAADVEAALTATGQFTVCRRSGSAVVHVQSSNGLESGSVAVVLSGTLAVAVGYLASSCPARCDRPPCAACTEQECPSDESCNCPIEYASPFAFAVQQVFPDAAPGPAPFCPALFDSCTRSPAASYSFATPGFCRDGERWGTLVAQELGFCCAQTRTPYDTGREGYAVSTLSGRRGDGARMEVLYIRIGDCVAAVLTLSLPNTEWWNPCDVVPLVVPPPAFNRAVELFRAGEAIAAVLNQTTCANRCCPSRPATARAQNLLRGCHPCASCCKRRVDPACSCDGPLPLVPIGCRGLGGSTAR